MANRYIDSHVHLFDKAFSDDLVAVLDRARSEGIDRFIVPGTQAVTSKAGIDLAKTHPGIYPAVGIHPHEAARILPDDEKEIERLSAGTGVVAIGEIGLDYFYDFAPKDVQQRLFRRQLALACKRNLPVIVHTRDSIEDALDMVEETVRGNPTWCSFDGVVRRGVFHCFSGTGPQALRLFQAGFYVSFPGILTFKKSPAVATLQETGLDRVMVETDAPYLAPVPVRGKRNEPAFMIYIARVIADTLGVQLDEVAERTTRNAVELFRLPPLTAGSLTNQPSPL